MDEAAEDVKTKLFCIVVGDEEPFPVDINLKTKTVGDLKKQIKAENPVTVACEAKNLKLFLARRGRDGDWLNTADAAAVMLDEHGKLLREFEKMDPTLLLEDADCFGDEFEPKKRQVHVLVVLPIDRATKRHKVEQTKSLLEIWKLSELQLAELPSVLQLKVLLEKPLPFKLTLLEPAVSADVFDCDGPPFSCVPLRSFMDAFLGRCGFLVEGRASENAWQSYYDSLLAITLCMCFSNGFMVQQHRNRADNTGTTKPRQRPDVIILYNNLVMLRGEEKSFQNDIAVAIGELTEKMVEWNLVLYGDLPYILGYATSGADLQLVAIERSGGTCRSIPILNFNILQNKAAALKLFYNLAFVLHQMGSLTKRSYGSLIPFKPEENNERKIVMLDSVVERTIKKRASRDDDDRLVDIYENLEDLSALGSTVTHLQSVEKLTKKRDGRLVVELSPIGLLRSPTVDEVSEWLLQMLTALKYWHGRGYCHGDLRWRNVVFVPMMRSSYWVLIDMDESFQSNEKVIQWQHQFRGQKLRFQHDLYQLGEMLKELPFTLPDDMKDMQICLLSAVDTPGCTVEDALARLL